MKKGLLDEQGQEEILHRIMKLNPATKGKWGSMTVNEMMFHCTKVNNAILSGKQPENKPTFRQKLIKTVGLNLMQKLPKGIKTNPKYFVSEQDSLDFYKERNDLMESINRVATYKDIIYGNHPFFGPLNTYEWKRFIWMHMDHHLRQFAV